MTSFVPRSGPPISPALHNMSARPRTRIVRTVPSIGRTWTLFPPLSDRVLKRGPRLSPERLAELDAAWDALGLVGATRVQPVTDLKGALCLPTCEDDDLNANVRLRLRGQLLLFAMPLLDDAEVLVGAARGLRGSTRRVGAAGLLCGDPRLHALVVPDARAEQLPIPRPRAVPAVQDVVYEPVRRTPGPALPPTVRTPPSPMPRPTAQQNERSAP